MGVLRSVRLAMRALLPRAAYRAVCRSYAAHQTMALRREIVAYLERHADTDEKRAVLDYLRAEAFNIFPYAYMSKYDPDKIAVESDGGMSFVMHRGKRLYFPTSDREEAAMSYCGLLAEQDPASPHCYAAEPDCAPRQGDVIADIGSADGIWALDNVENVTRGGVMYTYLNQRNTGWLH